MTAHPDRSSAGVQQTRLRRKLETLDDQIDNGT
jgi:hypothetical protein